MTAIRILLASLTAVSLSVPAHAQNAVAKVNGVTIPQTRMDMILKARAAGKQPDTPEVRNAIKESLINQEIVMQEAVKKGLDKNPEIATQLDLQRQEILANAYMQDYMRNNPISDDTLKKEYERAKATVPAKEYKARHILVDKEEDAKDVIAQIKKGGSFDKLAAEKSKDNGSKGRGGDLDWGPAQRYVKPFGEALMRLKKGQLTEAPVQSEFGWHVIRLDDERATKIPTFEEARPQLIQAMHQQQAQKLLADLRAKAKVE